MNTQLKQKILDQITEFYIQSRDFNGHPVRKLRDDHELDDGTLREYVQQLITEGSIALVFGDNHPNPHVLALPHEQESEQLAKLETSLTVSTCAYPTEKYLATVVDFSDYTNRPYVLELAQGKPSLTFRYFDLSVLEFYRNDPRYSYTTNDISGWIGIREEYVGGEAGALNERDQIFLQSFGFGYDDDLNRVVVVTVHYLRHLTPEHQQMWKLKELPGSYFAHPDYWRQISGEWPERMSIFDAFREELKLVNQMAELMGRPSLFRDCFAEESPREFAFLIRPTLTELNNFVHLLDKLMSENINKAFFLGEVEEEVDHVRKDGKIEVRRKGTIVMLDEWVKSKFNTPDTGPLEDMIKVFREVRNKRQRPAHAVNQNNFDQKYFHKQRDLIIRAYEAVRTLRLIFANHPKVKLANLAINEDLFNGNIWTY